MKHKVYTPKNKKPAYKIGAIAASLVLSVILIGLILSTLKLTNNEKSLESSNEEDLKNVDLLVQNETTTFDVSGESIETASTETSEFVINNETETANQDSADELTYFFSGNYEPVPLADALAAFRSQGYEPVLNFSDNADESNGYVFSMLFTINGEPVNDTAVFSFIGDDRYIMPGFTGAIEFNIFTLESISEMNYGFQDNTPIYQGSIDELTFLCSLDIDGVYWADVQAAFRSQGYEIILNSNNPNGPNGNIIWQRVKLLIDGNSVSSDHVYVRNGNSIYLKPGFEGDIIFNVFDHDYDRANIAVTSSTEGLTFLCSRDDKQVPLADFQAAFHSQKYEPRILNPNNINEANGYINWLYGSLWLDDNNGSYSDIYAICGNDIYVKPGFEGDIIFVVFGKDQDYISANPNVTVPTEGLTFLCNRDNKQVPWSDAQAAFRSQGYEPIILNFNEPYTSNGYFSWEHVEVSIDGNPVSADYIFVFSGNDIYIKPGFEGVIKFAIICNYNVPTEGLTFLCSSNDEKVLWADAQAAFRSQGYEPILIFDNPYEPNGYISWMSQIRALIDGYSVSIDNIYVFSGNDIYVKPGFEGVVEFIIKDLTEGLTFLCSRDDEQVLWVDAQAAFRSQGYEPILNSNNPNASNGYINWTHVTVVLDDKGVSGDEIYVLCGNDIYVKPGFEGDIIFNVIDPDCDPTNPAVPVSTDISGSAYPAKLD